MGDVTVKSCPFCGGPADVSAERGANHPSWWKVTCLDCGCRTMSNTTHRDKSINAWNRRASPPGFNDGVRAALEQGVGVWRSCTGCYETDEGYPTAPTDPVFGCERGGGCRECGGIGAVWDSTDFEDMADWIEREDNKDRQIRAALRMADDTFRDLGWHSKFEVTSTALKVLSLEAEPEPNPASFRAGVVAAAEALGKTLGMTLPRQQQTILALLHPATDE